MLLFYAGENRFAIDCSSISRVVPNVILDEVPDRALFVAGVMSLGNELIPVIDFCQIIEKRATHPFLNSRIILLRDSFSGKNRIVGLLGEKVEAIIDLHPDQFNQSEFYLHHFPYLDKGFHDDKGIIHAINLGEFFRFLSASVFHDSGYETYAS